MGCWYSLAQLVDVCNVGIHVVDVVGVGGVLGDVPLLRLGALGGEHVATVLGLVIHTVKGCDLQRTYKVEHQNDASKRLDLPSGM